MTDADADAVTPSSVTPGVTHFGAYHRPPDGHFFNRHDYDYPNKCYYDQSTCWVLVFRYNDILHIHILSSHISVFHATGCIILIVDHLNHDNNC